MGKTDESLTTQEKLEGQKEHGLTKTTDFILSEYKEGKISRAEAERMYRKEKPNVTDKNLLETFDRIDWEKAGKDGTNYSNYTPLYEAIDSNRAENIQQAAGYMLKHGYEAKDIKSTVNSRLKKEYLAATTEAERLRIRDQLTKTYKAIGFTAADADKTVQGWIKERNKTK